jgi:aldose sugar dehydrogenase
MQPDQRTPRGFATTWLRVLIPAAVALSAACGSPSDEATPQGGEPSISPVADGAGPGPILGGSGTDADVGAADPPPPDGGEAPDAPGPAPSRIGVSTVAAGLVRPWALAFLPDGRMLVTERGGALRVVRGDGTVSDPLPGVPRVAAYAQGGLLDVRPGPGFADDATIWFTFAEPVDGGLARTAVASAKLEDDALSGVTVIFRQQPAVQGGNHFGSRIAFAPDGNLFVTLGDRYLRDPAQDLGSHVGKVIRIAPDGSVPDGNPFVGVPGALPEIWSYGHRNPQGAAIEPGTGALWTSEHGPHAGDEINRPVPGGNYGWPLFTYGWQDGAETISGGEAGPPGIEPARFHWKEPGFAPSGIAFYTGTQVPQWHGDLFVGALAGRSLARLRVVDGVVVAEQRLLADLGERIRDVQMGPDGHLYLLTDSEQGRILRVEVR